MRSFGPPARHPHYPNRIHPALTSFADECCGMLARLFAYVGALALLAIVGIHLWDQLPAGAAAEPPRQAGWSLATRSYPAFAVSQLDLSGKTETYRNLSASRRRPQGRLSLGGAGRKAGRRARNLSAGRRIGPSPGLRSPKSPPGWTRKASRTGSGGDDRQQIRHRDPASAWPARPTTRAACLGFIKHFDEPDLRISGWSCQIYSLKLLRKSVELPTALPTIKVRPICLYRAEFCSGPA